MSIMHLNEFLSIFFFFFFQAEDGIRDLIVTGVQTCALPIYVTDADQEFQPIEWPRAEPARADAYGTPRKPNRRSEEHTSELQSRSDLVCRLLLEKKNKSV